MLHINFYDHRVCRKNIIYNWKQLSFKFLCKWWVSDFCKLWNRSQMDFSQWCSICSNFTRTCFNLWQGYLCLICNGRESGRERDREKEREREREKEGVFWDFVAFLLWNVFLSKTFYPRRKNLPAQKFAKQTIFLTICKNLYKWLSIYFRNCFCEKKKKTNIKEIDFHSIMKKHWH